MLNNYKEEQLLAYNLFYNDIINDCVTHAYLIDENNYSDSFGLVLAFIKAILCKEKKISSDNCNDCFLCKRIDDGNYPEIKVIEPDGVYIKKQQIIDLQQEFSRGAVEGSKKIYIIRDCEKMRPEAANSMLKFLEEPSDNIIAILMSNNINNVLSTIISRCKIIKLNNTSHGVIIDNEKLENLAIKFIFDIENSGLDLIVDINNIWFSVIGTKDREQMMKVFDIMIDIYYDIMNIILNNKNIKYLNRFDDLEKISKFNTIDSILNKINILIDYKDSIKYNVNSNLLIDSLIISIGGVNNGSRC